MAEDANAEAAQGGSTGDSSPDETVPLSALKAERSKRQTLEVQLAELRGKVGALEESKPKPKEYSRAELREAVDAGKISRDAADQILEDQSLTRLEQKVSDRLNQSDTARRITDEIARYKEFMPDLMEEGSEARNLVAEEYTRQIRELGKPETVQTELDALQATFGSVSKLRKAKEKEKETHQEVGSDGGEAKPEGKAPKLPTHAKAHYNRLIDRGIYKGWDDPLLQKEIGDHGGRWQ